MPRQERAVATRRAILIAAAEVFAASGYEAATIAEMLDRAGITKGALYFHFSSKEQLAVAVMSEQQDWLTQRPQNDASPLQDLVDLSYAFCDALRDDPLVQAAIRLTVERATFDDTPLRERMYGVWLERAESAIGLAHDAGQVAPQWRPPELARLVVACITGVQLASEAETGRADLVQRVQVFWTMLAQSVLVADFEPALRLGPPRRRD